MKKYIVSLVLSLLLMSNHADAATVYGANATKRDNSTPSAKIDNNQDKGRLRILYDSYTPSAELTSGDKIRMMKIPKGAKVYEAILHSPVLGSGGNAQLSVGWEAHTTASGTTVDECTDCFFSDIEGSSVIDVAMSDTQALPANASTFGSETQVTIYVDETTDAAIGDEIKLWIWYSK